MLKREQHFLDILFTLPAKLRYNFSPTAGSSLGVVRSEETRAKLSDANKGALNPMYGKVPANAFHPTPPTHCASPDFARVGRGRWTL